MQETFSASSAASGHGLQARLRELGSTRGLPEAVIGALAECSVLERMPLHSHLWRAGDPARFFALVVSGLVEGSRPTLSGENAVMGFFGPSDVVGIVATLQNAPYPGSARVISAEAELLKVTPGAAANLQLQELLPFRSWIQANLLAHDRLIREKIDILHAGSLEARVFELARHLARRFGKKRGKSRIEVEIRLDRDQIARFVNARKETVIRLLSSWKRAGLVHWDQEALLIHDLLLLERHVLDGRAEKPELDH